MSYPYSLIKTAITGDILDATDYNNEHQNHINNNIPSSIESASPDLASMQVTTSPGGVGTESLAADLLGEIQRLRYMMVQMAGGTYWYSAVTNNLIHMLPLSGGTMSGNIVMGTHKLTGLAAGSGSGDSLRYEQVIGVYLPLAGGTMSGVIAMGASKITGLGNGSSSDDAAAFGQIPTVTSGTFSPTITGLGTVSNVSGFYQRVGNMVHAWGSLTAGTVAASPMSITVPTGSIVYSNRNTTTATIVIGAWYNRANSINLASSGNTSVIFADGSDTGKLFIDNVGPTIGTAAFTKQNGNDVCNTGAYQSFDFWYAVA